MTTVTPHREVRGVQYVFVLDKRGNPLMPCTPMRAKELLKKGRAKVHHYSPFVIRLKDRIGGVTQPIGLGVDPGSRTTGMAVFRISNGGIRYLLFKLEIEHRSDWIHKKMQQRANYRRRRRLYNLRYRAPRFSNRTKSKGWLAPSLYSRVQHVNTWTQRLQRWCPLSVINMESVRFDTQALQNPEISGAEYQHGTLFGFEVREYLLLKWKHACAYCGATGVVLNIEHIQPWSKGGTNRISNLAIACVPCNKEKGAQNIIKFVTDPVILARIRRQAKASLQNVAAVSSTCPAVFKALQATGLPVMCSSGGRTKWNRTRFSVPKTHTLDAACIGDMIGIRNWNGSTLTVKAMGRGTHQRTISNAYGFPWKPRLLAKNVHGFVTGDIIKANVLKGKLVGQYSGRVTVRSRGVFKISILDGINYKYCTILQRNDGYSHCIL